MVSVCCLFGCSLIILTQFINVAFASFPPLEELHRVLDSSPERLAVAFYLFHATEFSTNNARSMSDI